MSDDSNGSELRPKGARTYPLVGTKKLKRDRARGSITGSLSPLPSFLPDTWESQEYPLENSVDAVVQWLDFQIDIAGCCQELEGREGVQCDTSVRDAYRLAEMLLREGRQRLTNRQDGPFPPLKAQEELWRVRDWVVAATTQAEGKVDSVQDLDGQSSVRVVKGKQRPIASVNARMLETMQANPEAMGWSCRQWSEYLKCGKSAVAGTKIWKDLGMRREREKAERAKDRRRKPKASDQRRE